MSMFKLYWFRDYQLMSVDISIEKQDFDKIGISVKKSQYWTSPLFNQKNKKHAC